jgi:hypothetical protein
MFAYVAAGWDSVTSDVIFFNRHVYNGFEGHKISFIFLTLYLFISFLLYSH